MAAVTRTPFTKAGSPNEIWSFDSVSDRAETGRNLKSLTIVDDCSKRSPGILTAHSITSQDVTDFMDSLKLLPKKLRCDNGPETTSRHFLGWAHERGIQIEFIQPGKPIQNVLLTRSSQLIQVPPRRSRSTRRLQANFPNPGTRSLAKLLGLNEAQWILGFQN